MSTSQIVPKPGPGSLLSANRSTRSISWDILRVVAVLAVVIEHITHQAPINHPELGPYPFSLPLQIGASTMLVISAYFVCVTVRKGQPGRWLWNRVTRLVPAYLVAVLAAYLVTRYAVSVFDRLVYPDGGKMFDWFGAVPVDAAVPTGQTPWYLPTTHDLVGGLLMITAWSPDFHWIDAAYWTMPVQMVAFVLAALLFPTRWRTDRRMKILLWAMVVVPLIIRFVWLADDPAQWLMSVFAGFALNRTQLFAVGIAIWLWSKHRLSTTHLAALLAAALIAQDAHAKWTDTPSTVALGVMLVVICAAARGPDWDVPLVRWLAPMITWLAGISYGVYLVHQELGFVLARFLLDLGMGPWIRIAASFALALVLGWLITRLVERPAHRWLSTAGPSLCGRVRGRLRERKVS